MLKKIIGLLFLPYLTFMLLEGCWDSQCDRRETRNITNLILTHQTDTIAGSYQSIILDMEYESYFVNNFRLDILPKTYAKSIEFDPCFQGFSNPIERVSVISSSDFDSDHLAGSEINSLFSHNYTDKNLDDFDFNPYHGDYYVSSQINIYNDSTPTLDSIHTLYFDIYCADGKTYLDTLQNVNLNKTVNRNYYY